MDFTKTNARPGKVIGQILEKTEKVLDSGIILQGSAVDKAMDDLRRCQVLTSGISDIAAGDTLIYLRFSGTPVGEEIVILDESDILATEL